jgi:hypothetical protein
VALRIFEGLGAAGQAAQARALLLGWRANRP